MKDFLKECLDLQEGEDAESFNVGKHGKYKLYVRQPEGGWEHGSLYKVMVMFRASNPPHEAYAYYSRYHGAIIMGSSYEGSYSLSDLFAIRCICKMVPDPFANEVRS